MALDVESFTDALLLGTKALIAKELAPLRAENLALRERLSALEGRPEPDIGEMVRSAVDTATGSLREACVAMDAKASEAVRVASGVAELDRLVAGLAGDLAEYNREIKAVPEMPDVGVMVAEAISPLVEAQSAFATKADVDAVRAAVAAVEPPSLPDVPALVADAVKAAVDALPKPQDGKDADPAEIEALRAEIADVRKAIPEPVALPEPVDLSGFATKADLAALPKQKDWSEEIAEVRSAIPAAPDLSGFATKADLDGLPKPTEPDLSGFATKAEMADAIAGIPTPDLPDLSGLATKAEVEAVRAEIPLVPEQKDFTPEIAALAARLEAIRIPEAIAGKDGLGIAEVKQNADGELIVKMTNGETVNAGKVRGADGLGFDDLDVEYDGERTITLVLTKGDRTIRKEMVLPIVLDRGIWREGTTYVRGDSISYAGSTFIVQVEETQDRPETSKAWRLACKRGRDGKSEPVKR